jgi:hypothetical protein
LEDLSGAERGAMWPLQSYTPRIKKSVQKVTEELQKVTPRPFLNSIFRINQATYHTTP